MIGITGEKRNDKARPESLRKQGVTPGVVYGPTREAESVSVVSKELERVYLQAGESTLLSLDIQGKTTPVLIHDVQKDPVSGSILHVDFYQPPLDKKIRIHVPLVFEGEAPGVKELGGTMLRNMHELEVEALPQDLPHEIVFSVEGLNTFEDRVLVKDIVVPQGVAVLSDGDEVVAQVVPAQDVDSELALPVQEAAVPEQAGEKKEEEETQEEKKKEEEEPKGE